MKPLLICMGLLFVFFLAPVLAGSEPNLPEMDTESRLTSLENRIEQLEARVEMLESRQQEEETSEGFEGDESNPDRDKLRIERVNRQIETSLDKIELIRAEIESLPLDYSSTENELTVVKKKARLFADMERSLLRIINLAERNPDIEIDIMAFKKELINCQAEKKKAYDEQENLREQIREGEKYLRY